MSRGESLFHGSRSYFCLYEVDVAWYKDVRKRHAHYSLLNINLYFIPGTPFLHSIKLISVRVGTVVKFITYYFPHFHNNSKDPSCYCLPAPLTIASGGSPIFPLEVHQSASPSFWPAVPSLLLGSVHKSSGDNVVRMCVQLKR